MLRRANAQQANVHHALLTDIWTAQVKTLERGIAEFAVPPAPEYHVSLFELDGDSTLHVNVTHRQQTREVKGWSGPGVSSNGFVHNRRFDSTPTGTILRNIREMVFAERA